MGPVERGKNCPHTDPAEKAAQVRAETDLGSPEIEGSLNRDNEENVLQLSSGQRRLAMTQEQSGRDADHAHDGTGRADQLGVIR